MRHGSLFSGVGGFDLAATWMGWENVFHCEWNPFGQKVLKHYWPESISYDDITKTDFTIHRGSIDILSGGFPCQPYSTAGKRLGKEDDRHLWPEMLRAIREIQPRWVVGENVSGLINWNGGMVFDEVQADLEAAGYEVIPFVLPACGVNAPHRRDRVWFVAYRQDIRCRDTEEIRREWKEHIENNGNTIRSTLDESCSSRSATDPDNTRTDNTSGINGNGEKENEGRKGFVQSEFRQSCEYRSATDPDSRGLERSIEGGRDCEYVERQDCVDGKESDATDPISIGQSGQRRDAQPGDSTQSRNGQTDWAYYDNERWTRFPTQPPVCSRNDGISARLVDITVSKHRQESIKAYGNAVVPQVVLQIFKAIEQFLNHPE